MSFGGRLSVGLLMWQLFVLRLPMACLAGAEAGAGCQAGQQSVTVGRSMSQL